MLQKKRRMPLVAGIAAVTCAMVVPYDASAQNLDKEWYEKSRCLGIQGMPWIESQKALKQKKRDLKDGRESAPQREWYEKSRCLGLEGMPWIQCRKALKQKKRERGDD